MIKSSAAADCLDAAESKNSLCSAIPIAHASARITEDNSVWRTFENATGEFVRQSGH
jgi:hypothetical protein